MRKFLQNNRFFLIALGCMLLIRTTLADWSPVPTGSMEPTIYPGDVVYLNKTVLGPSLPFTQFRLLHTSEPLRGDIITFKPPHTDETYIKRVIGLPGDRIRTEGLRVFVNDTPLPLALIDKADNSDRLYAQETVGAVTHLIQVDTNRGMRQIPENITVPQNAYFVMGDNRNNSQDSRYFGFVDDSDVIARATKIVVSIAEERNMLTSIASKLE